MFKNLKLYNWRQFNNIDINFHERLTILAGANGSGKTTILNILGRFFGWNVNFVSTLKKSEHQDEYEYSSDERKVEWFNITGKVLDNLKVIINDDTNKLKTIKDKSFLSEKQFIDELYKMSIFEEKKIKIILDFARRVGLGEINDLNIGELTFSNGFLNNISLPKTINSTYQVKFDYIIKSHGLYISSYRPTYSYQRISTLPTEIIKKKTAFIKYSEHIKNQIISGSKHKAENYIIKEILIQLALHGHGNKVIPENNYILKMFEDFQDTLKKILPRQLGFERFEIRMPEVILITKSGEFSLDAVSGGISALIDLVWQIFMFSEIEEPEWFRITDTTLKKLKKLNLENLEKLKKLINIDYTKTDLIEKELKNSYTKEEINKILQHAETPFVVLIDEPENHLYPELQKVILPNLMEAFPNAQFVISTHNPFIITSTQDSNLYFLNFNEDNKVDSILLKDINKSGTANEIFRDVLGVSSTKPLWVENKLKEIIEKYSQRQLDTDNLLLLKQDLDVIGFGKYIPETLSNLTKSKKNQ